MPRTRHNLPACPPAGRPPRTSALRLSLAASSGREYIPFLRRHLSRAAALVGGPLRELSIALVGDAVMSRLHQQFMSLPGPTDVLTFPMDEDSRGRVISGEIVICVPEARRRAGPGPHAARREVLLYAVHGMLHLCGYDDHTDAGFDAMHRREDAILTRLGVGPVFHRNEPTAGAQRATRKRSLR